MAKISMKPNMIKLTLLCIFGLLSRLSLAEKLQFSNTVGASGTTCYLENISETVQGKSNKSIFIPRSQSLLIVSSSRAKVV